MSNVPVSTPIPQPSSVMTVTSANQFNEQADFTGHVLSSLAQVNEDHEFIFTDVPFSWGDVVFRLIDEKIPSR